MSDAPQIVKHGLSAEIDGKLGELLDHARTQPGVSHAVLAIETLDQSSSWIGAVGEANPDGTRMTVDTPYWIASVTKLYIAMAIFKLIEQGEIQLGTPISNLLPSELLQRLHRLDGVDYGDAITVQHLLAHSSGLPDYLEESRTDQPALLDSIADEDQSWTIEDAVRIVREELVPHFPPQNLDGRSQNIRYSDTNSQLLIQTLETVHGKPLEDVFASDIYEPLGLSETRHSNGTDLIPRPASVWFGDSEINPPGAMRSFRDLFSTPREQLQFMRGLVSGALFDRPDTIYQMMGNWNSFPFSLNPMPKSPVWPIQYGLGSMRVKLPRIFAPLKPVPAVMGHTGISGSWLFDCPELQLAIAGTVDQSEAAAFPFRFMPRLIRSLQDDLKRN